MLKQTLVSGFWEAVDTLKGGVSLEEADHCGAGLRVITDRNLACDWSTVVPAIIPSLPLQTTLQHEPDNSLCFKFLLCYYPTTRRKAQDEGCAGATLEGKKPQLGAG